MPHRDAVLPVTLYQSLCYSFSLIRLAAPNQHSAPSLNPSRRLTACLSLFILSSFSHSHHIVLHTHTSNTLNPLTHRLCPFSEHHTLLHSGNGPSCISCWWLLAWGVSLGGGRSLFLNLLTSFPVAPRLLKWPRLHLVGMCFKGQTDSLSSVYLLTSCHSVVFNSSTTLPADPFLPRTLSWLLHWLQNTPKGVVTSG